MSAKDLSIEDKDYNELYVWMYEGQFHIGVNCGSSAHGSMDLDRAQAYLLFLYLQEHLAPIVQL